MDRYSLESDPSARSKAHCGLEPHEPRPTIIVHRKRDVLGYKPCVLVSQRHTKSDLLQRIEKVKRLGHTYTLPFGLSPVSSAHRLHNVPKCCCRLPHLVQSGASVDNPCTGRSLRFNSSL